jgi:hypothetical protein
LDAQKQTLRVGHINAGFCGDEELPPLWPSYTAWLGSPPECGNQVGHFRHVGQLELMNEFLLLAISVSDARAGADAQPRSQV